MKEIAVSIIIPIYNAEKYLEQCIESAINQTLTNIEIILINDGSKDNSELICKEFLKQDSRIKYYYKENEGLAAARQDGIEMAEGEYIGFIDSDDWVEKDMYEKMYMSAKKNNADVVLCNCYEYNEKKRKIDIRSGAYNNEQIKRELLPKSLIQINEEGVRYNIRWSNCLRIYKKDTINKYNIRFQRSFRRCQDLPFTLDMMLHSQNFYYVDDFLYHNRQDAGSLSRGYTKNMWLLIKPLMNYIQETVDSYEIIDLSEQINSTVFFLCIDCILNEFKTDAPKIKSKIKHIREIISDQECINALEKLEYKKLNSYYRNIFYRNMKAQKAGRLILEFNYYNSYLKRKIVAPVLNILTENKIYKYIRKFLKG